MGHSVKIKFTIQEDLYDQLANHCTKVRLEINKFIFVLSVIYLWKVDQINIFIN